MFVCAAHPLLWIHVLKEDADIIGLNPKDCYIYLLLYSVATHLSPLSLKKREEC